MTTPRSLIQLFVAVAIGLSLPCAGAQPKATEEDPTVISLDKQQLGAVLVAAREMRKRGRSIRGRQVRIEDHGTSIFVAFLEDPIDMTIVGSDDGITFEIRRRDLKLLRIIHDR